MTDRFSDTFIRPSTSQGLSNFSLAPLTNTQTETSTSDKKQQEDKQQKNDQWQQDAENYFNDFISIDEDKISDALAKLEEKRSKKRQQGNKEKSRAFAEQQERQKAIQEQTLIVSEAFKEITFSAEELALKKELAQHCVQELTKLVNKLCPEINLYFDLFSYDTLALLKANGFQDKIILNMMFMNYFAQGESSLIDSQQYIYFQLFLFYLDISMTIKELETYLNNQFNDAKQFEKIQHQLIRYIKLNARCFQSIQSELFARMKEVLPLFLKQIKRGKLNLSKKLAIRNLEHQPIKLKTKIHRVNKQIDRLIQKNQSIFNYLGENAYLLNQWKDTEYYICCIFILYYLLNENYPMPRAKIYNHLKSLGIRLKHPVIVERLKGFTLEELGRLQLSLNQPPPAPKILPKPPITVEEIDFELMQQNDLKTQEQWILYKTYQIENIKEFIQSIHLQHYHALLSKS